jgi:hypothetical protein
MTAPIELLERLKAREEECDALRKALRREWWGDYNFQIAASHTAFQIRFDRCREFEYTDELVKGGRLAFAAEKQRQWRAWLKGEGELPESTERPPEHLKKVGKHTELDMECYYGKRDPHHASENGGFCEYNLELEYLAQKRGPV